MDRPFDLSIFRLQPQDDDEKKPAAGEAQPAPKELEPEQTSAPSTGSHGMVLDLTNLTPETLDAFFPSEHKPIK